MRFASVSNVLLGRLHVLCLSLFEYMYQCVGGYVEAANVFYDMQKGGESIPDSPGDLWICMVSGQLAKERKK